jgi:pre-mRNA-splicing factor 18
MDALKALMAAKKKNLQDQKKAEPASNSITLGNGKKFHTRGDLKKLEGRKQIKRPLVPTEERRQNDQAAAAAASAKRMKLDAAEAKEGGDDEDDADLDATQLPRLEVRRRLRGMGEAVTLFGESDADRLKRLRKLEKHGQSVQNYEVALTGGASTRNVFVDRATGKELDEQNPEDSDESDDDADDSSDDDEEEVKKVPAATSVAKATTGAGAVVAGATAEVAKPAHVQKIISAREMKEKLARKEKKAKLKADSKRVHKYFKGQIKAWEMLLMARPDEVKRSSEGKMKAKQEKQCKDYVRPLFKLCKERTVPPAILLHLNRIVDHCEEGEFVRVRFRSTTRRA